MRLFSKALLAAVFLFAAMLPSAAHAGAGLDVDITAYGVLREGEPGPEEALADANPVPHNRAIRFDFAAEDAQFYECQLTLDGVLAFAFEDPPACDGLDQRTIPAWADGVYELEVRAYSARDDTNPDMPVGVGTPGPVSTFTWTADVTAPAVTVAVISPAGLLDGDTTNQTSATLALQATNPTGGVDETAEVTFSWRAGTNGDWTELATGADQIVLPPLTDGVQHIYAKATDALGNESTEADFMWYVDATAPVLDPVVRTGSGGAAGIKPEFGPESSIAFGSDDAAATYECRRGDAAWVGCTSPSTFPALTDGAYTFEVRATDLAGNTSPVSRIAWTVDTTAPQVTGLSPAAALRPAGDRNPSATFSFGTNESATFQCKTDDAAWVACDSPHTVIGITDGAHTFAVRAIDVAGHVSSATTATWTTELLRTQLDGAIVARPDGTATASWTGNGASYECSLDGGAWVPCTSPHTYAGLADGAHSIGIRGSDQGITEAQPLQRSFQINRSVALPPSDPKGPPAQPQPDPAPSVRVPAGIARPGKSSQFRVDAKTRTVQLGSTCTAEAGCLATRVRWSIKIGKKTYSGSFVVKARDAGKASKVSFKLSSDAVRALAKVKKGAVLTASAGDSKTTLRLKVKPAKKAKKAKKSTKRKATKRR